MGGIFLPAVVLNYLWEMAQMQFYVGANSPGAADTGLVEFDNPVR
jgi:hypothetical protein